MIHLISCNYISVDLIKVYLSWVRIIQLVREENCVILGEKLKSFLWGVKKNLWVIGEWRWDIEKIQTLGEFETGNAVFEAANGSRIWW